MSVRLWIDGQEIEVSEGTTLLEAAQSLGIEIPTLCHLRDLPGFSSCFVCAVRVEGRPALVPSCTAPAEQGMKVDTRSEEILLARRTALELLLSDHVGDCVAPCTMACPAGLDIPGFIDRLKRGNLGEAIALVKERIPLPSSLGRICARYCERACRRREIEDSIAICSLKRHVGDLDLGQASPHRPFKAPSTGSRVAIVGAGPAGLTAAFYLLQQGHDCELIDSESQPGGRFRFAIPEFRLPRKIVEAEAETVRRLGATFRMNTRLGRDIALDELRSQYDAVLLCLGAQKEERLIEGVETEGVCSGMFFLRVCKEGKAPVLEQTVLVLGEGDEAIDCARTALRCGASQVRILCSKTPEEMTGSREHRAAAMEEGVQFQGPVVSTRIESSSRTGIRMTGLCEGQDRFWEASRVLVAPERCVDVAGLSAIGLSVGKRGVTADRHTLETEMPGVFAAGEVVSGASAGVRSVAMARHAAVAIDQYLRGRPVQGAKEAYRMSMGKLSEEEKAILFEGLQKQDRCHPKTLNVGERRISFQEVESGLSQECVSQETARCLQCDCLARESCKLRNYATEYLAHPGHLKGERRAFSVDASHETVVYEAGKCILCGLCVRILEKEGEGRGMAFLGRGFGTRVGVPFDGSVAEGLGRMAERCADICPTGALARKRR